MFKITNKKGFHIYFKNGWGVSVQFGLGNYCDNYRKIPAQNENISSATAECAIFMPNGNFYPHELFNGDTVGAYLYPEQIIEIMNWTEAR